VIVDVVKDVVSEARELETRPLDTGALEEGTSVVESEVDGTGTVDVMTDVEVVLPCSQV